MSTNTVPAIPVPAGATADDWVVVGPDVFRSLEWSRHDTEKVAVSVDGWQYADGTVEPQVSVYIKTDDGFTAEDARALAAALTEAAAEFEAKALHKNGVSA